MLNAIGITGSGPNGAIIHYRAEPGSCGTVDAEKLFLLDSGAQFVDGTTDITRTVHFGEPTAREKECFTRVLQVKSSTPFSHLFEILEIGCEIDREFFPVLSYADLISRVT